ncbi:helix-turn-helix domain-containing protein [Aurantiacibacter luteus]|uniref:helix-turn-helix domain-containing protein n=1 Tax=Aurantiacibacter luteus TaxID=1581420 RepID=UPI00069A172D|nr:helix-turn-helix domain-containing protein [Aurantiacibacter luteus]
MSDETEVPAEDTAPAAPVGVGPQLRAAREGKGLTLDQVAAETRISRRHLEHLEAGEFEALAGKTYAIGFAKTYARTVGLNQSDVAAMVRAEMGAERTWDGQALKAQQGSFEPGDPARTPGGKLVWFSLFAVVLLLVGIFFAARVLFSPAAEVPSLTEQQAREEREQREAAEAARQRALAQGQQGAGQAAGAASGPVVFTAEQEAWVRFYDAQGRVLSETVLQPGDTYQVPADADNPMVITGRPQVLAITVGGEPVAKLSYEQETVTDVPVNAAALLARQPTRTTRGFSVGSPASAPAPAPATATPAASAPQPAARAPAAPRPAPPRAVPAPAPVATVQPAPEPAPEPATAPEPAAVEPDAQ